MFLQLIFVLVVDGGAFAIWGMVEEGWLSRLCFLSYQAAYSKETLWCVIEGNVLDGGGGPAGVHIGRTGGSRCFGSHAVDGSAGVLLMVGDRSPGRPGPCGEVRFAAGCDRGV